MDTRWRITLLGGLRAEQGGRVITRFRTQKTASLLAHLAFYGERVHRRETLIELFWAEARPEAGRNNLSKAISSLRQQLEPPGVPTGAVLMADRYTLRLNPAAATTDVAEFEAHLRSGARSDNDGEKARHLTTAVELYRGALLDGLFEEWIDAERQRLADAYLNALRQLTRLLGQAKEFDRAIDYARRAVNADPLQERSHRTLMRLYAAVGRPAAALEQFVELERILKADLGGAPSATTRNLAREISEQLAVNSQQLVLVGGGQSAISRHVPKVGTTSAVGKKQKAEKKQVTVGSQTSPAPILQFPVTPHQSSTIDHQPFTVGSLPLQFTRFFGREEEIARLRTMLLTGDTRLVTLTGLGGSGKTRLAIEVAGQLQEDLSGGVWFVPLTDVTDPRLIVATVRDTLRLSRSAEDEPLEQVVNALNRPLVVPPLGGESRWDKPPEGGTTNSTTNSTTSRSVRSLLVLDNFEQLAAGGALIVLTLLKRVRSLSVLVTSRRRLDVAGEREFMVSPLPLPEHPNTRTPEHLMSFPSVQLFVDRAQAKSPDFQLTPRNARAVAELCGRLEGIPLAIELAAARAQVLTPAQMLDRISKRFDLLSKKRADTSERHRSLWAAMEWSYHLLSPELQRFFAQLSVFRGGWMVEAAEKVCFAEDARIQGCRDAANDASPVSLHPCLSASVVEYLSQLRSHSLIVAEEGEPEMRYRMLETLREFAAEQLTADEREMISRRHAHYFLALAEQIEPKLFEAEQAAWLERLEAEHDNLRTALTWCAQNDTEAGLRLAAALLQMWFVRGYVREGRDWMEDLLRRAESVPLAKGQSAPSSVMAKALCRAGFLAWYVGDYEQADMLCERSLKMYRELQDDKAGMAFNLCGIAATALSQGDYARAQAACEESLSLWQETGNQWGAAMSLYSLGRVRFYQEEYGQSRTLLEEAIALLRTIGRMQDVYVAWSLCLLGHVGLAQGDYGQAQVWLEESLPLFQQLGHTWGTVSSLVVLGCIAFLRRDDAQAQSLLRESLALFKDTGVKATIHLVQCLEILAGIAYTRGDEERAARLCGAVEALQRTLKTMPFPPGYSAEYQHRLNAMRADLNDDAFADAWAQGRAMTREEVVRFALEG